MRQTFVLECTDYNNIIPHTKDPYFVPKKNHDKFQNKTPFRVNLIVPISILFVSQPKYSCLIPA